MSAGYNPFSIKRYCLLILLGIIFICPETLQANPKKPIFAKQKKTIVLDPGHGGHDNGALGSEGAFEKNVTLELAISLPEHPWPTMQKQTFSSAFMPAEAFFIRQAA
jgi:hypothetical protein